MGYRSDPLATSTGDRQPDDPMRVTALQWLPMQHLQRSVMGSGVADASPSPGASVPATTLLTEDLDDAHDNGLGKAVTWADADRHQLVFMDATDGGPGHVLIQDKATGRVWDVNDGPPLQDASTWHHASARAWAQAQPGSADGVPAFEAVGTLQVGAVRGPSAPTATWTPRACSPTACSSTTRSPAS